MEVDLWCLKRGFSVKKAKNPGVPKFLNNRMKSKLCYISVS